MIINISETEEKTIEINVDKLIIQELKNNYQIIQCITPNILNLFNDIVIDNLQLILLESNKIINNNAFITTESKIQALINSIVILRESLFSCGSFLKENYHNGLLSLLGTFTCLIGYYEKCKEIVINL